MVPVITEEDLKTFCDVAQRENVTTSHNMYKESFLVSCRIAQKDGDYYATGLCASEMRKTISYNVTIKLKDHIVLEAQCECAAGIGPYAQCKHVIVVLCGIVDFNETKTIKTKSSCTSTLQTFHHPTGSYSGNPVQAAHLTLKFKNKQMKEMTTFDPRPTTENVEKYRENFNNIIGNYCGGNMPISQLIKPADKKSMYGDHDYLQKTAEEQYFEGHILTDEQLNILQRKPVTDRKNWLEERKLRLQSSDFGKICKQKKNKLTLARSLIKSKELHTDAIKHGIKYEQEAIEKFQQVTGLLTTKCGIIVHPHHQFLGCTPDALVENNEVLEVKCPYTARNQSISVENVPYLYLCERSGKYKLDKCHDYYYQIQGQLFCSQRNIAHFFVYTMCDFYVIKIEHDNNFTRNMFAQLESFYDNYYKQVLLDRFLYR